MAILNKSPNPAARPRTWSPIFKSGRIASMMGVEGGHSMDSSLGTLRMLCALGARYPQKQRGPSTETLKPLSRE